MLWKRALAVRIDKSKNVCLQPKANCTGHYRNSHPSLPEVLPELGTVPEEVVEELEADVEELSEPSDSESLGSLAPVLRICFWMSSCLMPW